MKDFYFVCNWLIVEVGYVDNLFFGKLFFYVVFVWGRFYIIVVLILGSRLMLVD